MTLLAGPDTRDIEISPEEAFVESQKGCSLLLEKKVVIMSRQALKAIGKECVRKLIQRQIVGVYISRHSQII